MKALNYLNRIFLGAAIAASVFAAAIVVENARASSSWRKYLEAREAVGDFVLHPPSPARRGDPENFMNTPPLDRWLVDAGAASGKKVKEWRLPFARLYPSYSWRSGIQPHFNWPETWIKFSPPRAFEPMSEREGALLLMERVESTAPELNALRHAALEKSASYVAPSASTPPDGLPEPYLGVLLQVSQLLVLDGSAALTAGEVDKAYADLLGLLKLGEGFCSEPQSYRGPFFFASNPLELAMGLFWQGWSQRSWSASQYEAIQAEVRRIHYLDSSATGLLRQRFEMAQRFTVWPDQWMRKQQGWSAFLACWRLNNLRHYCETIDARADALRRGGQTLASHLRETSGQEATVFRRIEKKSGSAVIWASAEPTRRAYDSLAMQLQQASLLARSIQTEAYLIEVETVCELERYHFQKGTYPRVLDDLVPEFTPQLRKDATADQPLRYQLISDREFLLYSVGSDGVDDGGSNADLPFGIVGTLRPGTDLVWPSHALSTERKS